MNILVYTTIQNVSGCGGGGVCTYMCECVMSQWMSVWVGVCGMIGCDEWISVWISEVIVVEDRMRIRAYMYQWVRG